MNYIDFCPICGAEHKKLERMPSYVSPFISHYVFQREPFPVNLLYCSACDFLFFEGRPDDKEMGVLYDDYRGAKYTEVRAKCEPGYTKSDAHSPEQAAIDEKRRNHLDGILGGIGWKAKLGSTALDHGGDSGQFFGAAFRDGKKYVYEISGVKPVEGVEAIRSDVELRCRTYDFIMSNHVLEHVADPVAYIKDLKSLGHSQTMFYLETPCECPAGHVLLALRLAKKVARILKPQNIGSSNGRIGKFLDQVQMRPWLHEHINFFSASAVRIAFQKAGLKVLQCDVRQVFPGHLGKWVCCVAQLQ